ncbi:MAG: lysine--tRNA ligase [archaeon]
MDPKDHTDRERLHWADQIAREVLDRVEHDEALKAIVKDKGYIVYDEKTPSGKIHIGSGRGWIIHDVIAKALRKIGLKGRFVLSSDDIDPFDKMNSDLPKEFEQYIGLPFMAIPSPVEGYKSYADYYFKDVTDRFADFGIDAELESTGQRYIDGDFDWAIKKALDNNDKIKAIYERFYGSAPDKLFFNPICEKCGKIGTTRAVSWDPDAETIVYRCEENLVKWARGCGHEGTRSPFKGGGKLPWKVEWAAKWPVVGVVCEYAGKDHFTKGGSRDISVAIADEVFDFLPPYPSTRKRSGRGYEFFNIGGKKMSTSKGTGISFSDSPDYAPAEILRYLLVATRPHAVIDFDPVGKNDLVLLFERFDRTERIYFGAETLENKHERQKHARIYELSHIGEIPSALPPQISFANAAVVIQVALGDVDWAIEKLQATDQVPGKLTGEQRAYLNHRLLFAKKWVTESAPDHYKFEVQNSVPSALSIGESEKNALLAVTALLRKAPITEEELHNGFFSICQELDLPTKDFFKAAYSVLIAKERGPKLAPFIVALGQDRVADLFEKAG